MKIQQQLTKKEFQTAATIALFNKLSIKIIYGIFVLLSITSIVLKIVKPEIGLFWFSFVILIIIPLFSYITTGKRYDLNEDMRHPVTFEFINDTLSISGSGISIQMPLKKLHHIIEKKKWFFIQQTSEVFYPISKEKLTDDQVQFLRKLIEQL